MNCTYIVSLTVGLGLTVSGSLLAQQPDDAAAPPELAARQSVLQQSFGVVETGDQLRAVGPRYRAVFDADGLTFTPALGSNAPKSYPLRLEVVAVTRGDKVLYDHAKATAKGIPTADGQRVSIARAPTMTERFDAIQDGVELSWRFDAPLDGAGDLVVRYRVVTELPPAADGAAWLMPALGGVTVGSVHGIDAVGEACAGSLRREDGFLELALPGSFVDGASYPLILDPVVGSSVQVRIGTNDSQVDVSYDASFDRYLFVWQTVFSQTDVEIRGQLTDVTGAKVGTDNFLVYSPASSVVAMRPRVANVDNSARFLIVWQEGQSIFGEFDVYCASVNPSTGVLSNVVPIATSSTVDEAQPDVANTRSTDNDALVVWRERGNGIRGSQVDVPSVGDPLPVGSVASISTYGSDETPAISDGGSTYRVVTWLRPGTLFPISGPTILARATNINLSLLGTEFVVVSGNPFLGVEVANPAVDGDGVDFMVAWDNNEVASTIRNVGCRLIRYTSGDLAAVTPPEPAPTFAANAGDDEFDPAVAVIGTSSTGLKYCLAWTDGVSSTSLNSVIGVMTVSRDGCVACSGTSSVGGGPAVDFGAAIASRYQAGENADDCMIAFSSADATPLFDPDIWTQRYEAYGSGGSTASLGGGCGVGGTTGYAGFLGVGSPAFEVRLSGAAGALGGVLVIDQSPPVNPVVPCGTCTVLAGITTQPPSSFDGVTGMAAAALPIPCTQALIGGQLEVQWLTVNIGSSPCPIVPNISASNRLRLVIGE